MKIFLKYLLLLFTLCILTISYLFFIEFGAKTLGFMIGKYPSVSIDMRRLLKEQIENKIDSFFGQGKIRNIF